MVKKVECGNCYAEYKITLLNDEVEDVPQYCPFCGAAIEAEDNDAEEWEE